MIEFSHWTVLIFVVICVKKRIFVVFFFFQNRIRDECDHGTHRSKSSCIHYHSISFSHCTKSSWNFSTKQNERQRWKIKVRSCLTHKLNEVTIKKKIRSANIICKLKLKTNGSIGARRSQFIPNDIRFVFFLWILPKSNRCEPRTCDHTEKEGTIHNVKLYEDDNKNDYNDDDKQQ